MTNLDPDALDALLGGYQNSWYSRGCCVGKVIAGLDDGPFRTKLVAYMAMPVCDLGHSPIARAIEETLGVKFPNGAVGRHRGKKCSCGSEVWQ